MVLLATLTEHEAEAPHHPRSIAPANGSNGRAATASADRSSETGQLLHFLSELSCMKGQTASELHTLTKLFTRRVFPKGQLCMAHPPDARLGPAAYSADVVYVIYRGEARLLCAPLELEKPTVAATALDPSQMGPLGNATTFPSNRVIEASLGGELHPVATLGPTECVTQSLLASDIKARWCLQPVTPLELLVLTRRDWNEIIKPGAAAALKQHVTRKAGFFAKQLASVQATSQLRRSLVSAPRVSPQAPAYGPSDASPASPSASAAVLGARERGSDSPDAERDEPDALRHILRDRVGPGRRGGPTSTGSSQGSMAPPASSAGGKPSDGRSAGRATKADDGFFVHLPMLTPPVWLDFFEKE